MQTGFSRRLLLPTLHSRRRLGYSGCQDLVLRARSQRGQCGLGGIDFVKCRVPSAEGRLCPDQPRRSGINFPGSAPAGACAPAESAGTRLARSFNCGATMDQPTCKSGSSKELPKAPGNRGR